MRKKPKNATRGGARPGAGKKPGVTGTKVNKMQSFSRDVFEFLESLKRTDDKPDNPGASAFLEGLVRDSPAFQAWSKKKAAKKKPG